MPDRNNRGTRYDNRQRAVELQGFPAHAHTSAAVRHGMEDHLTAHEQTRQAHEHSRVEFEQSASEHTEQADNQAAAAQVSQDDIARLAYQLWQDRGSPEYSADGSADEDWLAAERILRGASHD